jgi:hypothetical protein
MTDTAGLGDELMGATEPEQATVVGQARQKVQEQAEQAKGQLGDQLRSQVSQRSNQAGEQAWVIAEALRAAAGRLREEGQTSPARLMDRGAEQADRLARYLSQSDAERILADTEAFGRSKPWAVMAAGLGLGVAAARFLKASSRRRYQSAQYRSRGS